MQEAIHHSPTEDRIMEPTEIKTYGQVGLDEDGQKMDNADRATHIAAGQMLEQTQAAHDMHNYSRRKRAADMQINAAEHNGQGYFNDKTGEIAYFGGKANAGALMMLENEQDSPTGKAVWGRVDSAKVLDIVHDQATLEDKDRAANPAKYNGLMHRLGKSVTRIVRDQVFKSIDTGNGEQRPNGGYVLKGRLSSHRKPKA